MKTFLKYFISFGLGGGLLWYVYRDIDSASLLKQLQAANIYWVIACIITAFFAHWARAMRWRMLLGPLGKTPAVSTSFYAVMSGYAINMAVTRLGEVSRCAILTKEEDIPIENNMGTVLAERLMDLLFMVAVILLTLWVEKDTVINFISARLNAPAKVNADTGINYYQIGFLAILIIGTILYFTKKELFTKVYNGIINFFKGLLSGILSFKNVKNIPLFIFYSSLIWVMYYGGTLCLFKAFTQTSVFGLDVILVIFTMGSLGMILPSPGGVGTFHTFVTEGLIIFGMTHIQAAPFAAVAHGIQSIGILILWVFSWIAFIAFKKKGN